MTHPNKAVAELIARSNRLGPDPKNTNYAGGIPVDAGVAAAFLR